MTDHALAAIDVGTNSIHMVVARPTESGPAEVLTREKAVVRLGSGASDMKHLDADAVDRAVEALDRFRRIADAHGAEVVAIATSAVREAEDRHIFLRRARLEAGVEVEVISGTEEARLIHLGALSATPVADRRHLIVDIGGGSTELVVGKGTEPLLARSLKLGHIRLTERFFPGGDIADGSLKQCRHYIRSFIAPVALEIRDLGFEVAVGSSGTIETIMAMIGARSENGLRSVDNAVIGRSDLDEVYAEVVARPTAADRSDIPGLESHRRDLIVAGTILLRQLFKTLRIEEMIVSPSALREGILLDRLNRSAGAFDGLHHLSDLRRSSVLSVARRYEENLEHAEHATDLALELFDQLTEVHGYGSLERDVLEAAGVLHNIGRFVAHEAHHKHSYYLVRNSEHMAGFTAHELDLIALVARYHRKSKPREKHPEFAALEEDDRRRVRILSGMLRIGIALDRTYRRAVQCLRVKVDDARVVVEAVTDLDDEIELELYTAHERRELLQEALGRDVTFEAVSEPGRGMAGHPANAFR